MTPELLARVGLAVIAGAVIGVERQIRDHPAGVRTHALVAGGSAIFALTGTLDWGTAVVDPTRIAAQVVSGIGFIGAGAILRDGFGVRGLTTASTIWASGAMGLAAAVADLSFVAGSLGIIMVVLIVLRAVKRITARVGHTLTTLELEYDVGHGTIGPVLTQVDHIGGKIERLIINDIAKKDRPDLRRVHLMVQSRTGTEGQLLDLAGALEARPEVRSVKINGDEGDWASPT